MRTHDSPTHGNRLFSWVSSMATASRAGIYASPAITSHHSPRSVRHPHHDAVTGTNSRTNRPTMMTM